MAGNGSRLSPDAITLSRDELPEKQDSDSFQDAKWLTVVS